MQKMMRENLKKSILIIVVLRPDYATLLLSAQSNT